MSDGRKRRSGARRWALGIAAALIVAVAVVVAVVVLQKPSTSRSSQTGVSDEIVASSREMLGADGWLRSPEQELAGAMVTEVSRVVVARQYSMLLGERTSEVFSEKTLTNLRAAADSQELPADVRIAASAALVQAGKSASESETKLALDVVQSFGDTVDIDELEGYFDAAMSATVIAPGTKLPALEGFDPGSDGGRQKLAAAALANSYLFSNEDKISAMFPKFQSEMMSWLRSDTATVDQFLYSAAALPNSSIETVSPSDLEHIAARLLAWRSCTSVRGFIGVTTQATNKCSLALTVVAQGVPDDSK